MEKKSLLLIILLVFVVPLIHASNLVVTPIDNGSVVISELNNPAVFEFNIMNNGPSDNYQIFSYVGVSFSPRGTFEIPSGNSTLEVKAYPDADVRKNVGLFKFQYQLSGQNTGNYQDFLTIKIVSLADAIEINPENLAPNENAAVVVIKNKENTYINNLKVHLTSSFFDTEQTVSLSPNQELPIAIPLDKSKTAGLIAGTYVITASVNLQGAQTRIDGVLNYLEEQNISVSESSSGVIVRRTEITKTNNGNVAAKAQIQMSKDIISRLFTIYSIQPLASSRDGLHVNYIWEKSLNPGESYTVDSTTNYTFPFILLIIIVIVIVLAKIYSENSLSIEKRVSYVKSNKGLALKVTLHVKARRHIDNIQVIDRLPAMSKLYEKYGRAPDKVDQATKRISWNISSLNSGEERVFSYIVYSGLNIVGRYELPSAAAIFERDGKTIEVASNKTYFAVDTKL